MTPACLRRVRVVLLALVLASAPASADRRWNSLSVCAGVGLDMAKPAVVEWTTWIGGGGGSEFGLRAGAGLDFELVQIKHPWHYGGPVEVRLGPWLGAETFFDHHLAEAGLALDIGQTRHASFGTYTLRAGIGIDDDRRTTTSLTLLGGVRYVPARHSSGGGCVTGKGIDVTDDGDPRKTVAHASGARLFATVRSDIDGRSQWLFGIEFDPTWVLPPYSLGKLGGGPPTW